MALSFFILQGSPSSFDRTSFLVTYSGEGNADDNDPACGDIYDVSQFMICEVEFDCRCQDTKNNTYACVRSVHRYQGSAHVSCHPPPNPPTPPKKKKKHEIYLGLVWFIDSPM